MAEITLCLEDLLGGTTWPLPDGEMIVEFVTDSAVLKWQMRKLWALVLLMAVRDRAASVHYHPWRADGQLAYLVGGVRYVLVPPPDEFAPAVVDAARSLFTPRRGWLSRLLSPRPTVFATVTLAGQAVTWDAACWTADGRRNRVVPRHPTGSFAPA